MSFAKENILNMLNIFNFMHHFVCKTFHLKAMSIKTLSHERWVSLSSFAFLHHLRLCTYRIYTMRIIHSWFSRKKLRRLYFKFWTYRILHMYMGTQYTLNLFASSPSSMYQLSLLMHIFSSPIYFNLMNAP